MAEVADFNFSSSLYDPFEEDEVEPEDSISYWPHEFDHEEIYSSDPDLADRFDDPEDEEEMAAVEDFGSDSDSVAELNDFMGLENEVTLTPNSNSHSILDGEDDFGFGVENDGLDLGLGLGLRLGGLNENDENDELELELGLGLDGIVGEDDHDDGVDDYDENGGVMVDDDDGVDDYDGDDDRVFGVESDFQEEEEDELFGVGFDLNEDDGMDDVPQGPWEDSPEFDDGTGDMNEFYEWEDVDDAGDDDMVVPQPDANERLVPTGVLDVGMDFEQRLPPLDSLVAEAYGGEGEVPDHEDVAHLEWQILMHVSMERNGRRGFVRGDFVLPAEYDMLLAQFAENTDVIRGSPPAARLVVENLPTIVLIEDDVNNDGSMCAVCKDEISSEEQVKLLPCSHFYHGDCILPWLEIHNTCPVCRFELPTDDPEYEQSRARRHNRGA